MTDISSWGWYAGTPWPGYSAANQDNLTSNGNGMSVDPATYAEFTIRDANSDGVIYDYDTDDVAAPQPDEYIFAPSLTLYPQEVSVYSNSTVVIGGVTYSNCNIIVTLFTDGTWGARIHDNSLPAGTNHAQVESITLGTWDGIEYDGVYTSSVDQPFVCFVAGTLIETADGPQRIETLRPGDMVLTRDRGFQALRWVGMRRVAGVGKNAPVRIAAGTFGEHQALCLSPQHRVLLLAGTEVLATTKHLVNGTSIRSAPRPFVIYIHLLFDRHEIIYAEGLAVESLWLGPQARRVLSRQSWEQICAIFPRLIHAPDSYGPDARPTLKRRALKHLEGPAAPTAPERPPRHPILSGH